MSDSPEEIIYKLKGVGDVMVGRYPAPLCKKAADLIQSLQQENAAFIEGYQLVADHINYDGDWHEHEPIRQLIAENEALKELVRDVMESDNGFLSEWDVKARRLLGVSDE